MPGQGLLFFILLLGVLILVHELGHFLVAKLFRVQVFKFSFGFGPELFGFRIGETRYAVSVVPLGGFVRMAGEADLVERWGGPEAPPTDPERLLTAKPLWQRGLIILAGPFANILLPFVIFSFTSFGDSTFMPPLVGTVLPGSPAERAQLQGGDRIISVDGETVKAFGEIAKLVGPRAGETVVLEIERSGVRQQVPLTLRSVTDHDELQQVVQRGRIGVGAFRRRPVVAVTHADSAAAQAGLRTLDRVLRVDGQEIQTFDELQRALITAENRDVTLLVERRENLLGSPLRLSVPTLLEIKLSAGGAARQAPTSGPATQPTPAPANTESFHALAKSDEPAQPPETAASDTRAHALGVAARVHVYLDELDAESIAKTHDAADAALAGVAPELRGLTFAGACLDSVLDDTPAATLGLQRGDCLLAMDGRTTPLWSDVEEIFTKSDAAVHLAVASRNGVQRVVAFRLDKRDEKAPLRRGYQRSVFGHQQSVVFTPGATETITRDVFAAIANGAVQTASYTALTVTGIGLLATGQIPFSTVGGPLMLYDLAGRASERGAAYFLFILAFISINLAVLNLLPVPVLDGGHLLFFVIEAVQRRPASTRTREIANVVGLVLLILLMVAVFRNDIARYFF